MALGTSPEPRVRESWTGTGTGNAVLDGTSGLNVQTFLSAYGGGTTGCPYLIEHTSIDGEWEEGLATVQDSGGSSEIVRTALGVSDGSSGSGTLVSFSAGTKLVFSPLSSEQNTAVFDHVESTSNPHSVTQSQVGLGNVTNDAQLKISSNLADLGNVSSAQANLNLDNVPNEDATDMFNWDQRGASDGDVATWSSSNSRWEPQGISTSPVIAQYSSTDTSVNVNNSTPTRVVWDSDLITNANFTKGTSNEQVTVGSDGTYMVTGSITYTSNGNSRMQVIAQVDINGTVQSAAGRHGYARASSGDDEATSTIIQAFELSNGDAIAIVGSQGATGGTGNVIANESLFIIQKL